MEENKQQIDIELSHDIACLLYTSYIDLVDALPADNQHLDDDDPNKFIAKMGAEAIGMLLERLNLDDLSGN